MRPDELEKYSSAITLSDMEIFVFPDLMYSLVLANIMSPIIWQWRELDCFKKLDGKDSYKKLMRLKQFIMDEYDFNLDLETWGLTNRNTELARFSKFIAPEEIAKSNAADAFSRGGNMRTSHRDIQMRSSYDHYSRYASFHSPNPKSDTTVTLSPDLLHPDVVSCIGLSGRRVFNAKHLAESCQSAYSKPQRCFPDVSAQPEISANSITVKSANANLL